MGRSFLFSEPLAEYVNQNWLNEHPVLTQLREDTAKLAEAGWQISADQGQWMQVMVRALRAKRILEIGVFTGYSSTAMALALPDDGEIIALDISEEFTSIGRRAWEAAGVSHKVKLHVAPALETLAALTDEASFDLAFIDADKPNYRHYYEHCLRLVRPGGVILIDNVLWSGRVADTEVVDESTLAIRELNAFLAHDPRVEVALCAIGDGISMAYVR
ncbi:MAG: O-methyltransferase [Fimbriimonas sp.]